MMINRKPAAAAIGKILAVTAASLIGAVVFWLSFAFFLSDTVDIDARRTYFDTLCDIVGWVGGLVIALIGAVAVPIHMIRKMMIGHEREEPIKADADARSS